MTYADRIQGSIFELAHVCGGVKKNLKIPKRISEMKNRRIDNTMAKVDLVITDTPTFQIFIQKPLKSLSSKRKRAIIHER